jgi:O-antigen ligase
VIGVAGVIAIAVAAPRLPLRWVTIPLGLLLLFVAPSIPLEPSFDEGAVPEGLYLPILSLRYADFPSLELLEWLRLLGVLAVGGIAAWAVRDRRTLEVMVAVMLASAVVPCLTGLEQFASGDTFTRFGSELDAIRGPFTHQNYFAFYLVVVVAIGTIALLEARALFLRIAAAVPIALASVCLVLTYTRAAWIGLAIVLLLLAVLRDRRILAAAGMLLIIASIAFPAAREDVEGRFAALGSTSKNGSETDNSWGWRTGQWERMLPHGSEHPWTGEGFGSYSRVTLEEFGTGDLRYSTLFNPGDPLNSARGFSAHNDYVKMFVETGFVGLALWVAFLGGLVVSMLAARRVAEMRGWAECGLALALALAVMSASDNVQGYTAVMIYLLALIGGIAGAAGGIAAARRRDRMAG